MLLTKRILIALLSIFCTAIASAAQVMFFGTAANYTALRSFWISQGHTVVNGGPVNSIGNVPIPTGTQVFYVGYDGTNMTPNGQNVMLPYIEQGAGLVIEPLVTVETAGKLEPKLPYDQSTFFPIGLGGATYTLNQEVANSTLNLGLLTSMTFDHGTATQGSAEARTNGTVHYRIDVAPVPRGAVISGKIGFGCVVTSPFSQPHLMVMNNNAKTLTSNMIKFATCWRRSGALQFQSVAGGAVTNMYVDGLARLSSSQVITSGFADRNLVGFGDMNGDNLGDLLYKRPTDGLLTQYFTNGGASVFGAVNTWQRSDSFRGITNLFDVNKDGNPDVITSRGVRNLPSVITFDLMMGIRMIPNWKTFTLPAGYSPVGACDMTGDGNVDYVMRDDASGAVVITQLDANYNIITVYPMNQTPPPYTRVECGDVTNDGIGDIAIEFDNGGVNSVRIYVMTGDTNGNIKTTQTHATPAGGGLVMIGMWGN